MAEAVGVLTPTLLVPEVLLAWLQRVALVPGRVGAPGDRDRLTEDLGAAEVALQAPAPEDLLAARGILVVRAAPGQVLVPPVGLGLLAREARLGLRATA